MKDYAVIRINGNQYLVSQGDEILVDRLSEDKVSADVLLLCKGGKVEAGKPTLDKVKIGVKILEKEVKGKKLHVRTFKAKSRYRRHIGFRPSYTKILIDQI